LQSAFPITLSLLLLVVAFLYLRGWLRLRAVFPHLVSVARPAAFFSGLALVWVAAASPLAHLDHELLSAHMIQHLLLMAVAAPLILFGAPGPVLLRALPKSFSQGATTRLLRHGPVHRFAKITSRSAFCWLAGVITVLAWHVPALFQLAHHSVWWHELEQATFLLAGLLFWWPVIQALPGSSREPRWSIALYLFLATLPCDALSAYFVFCDHLVYRSYLFAPRLLGLSPLQDQQWAGTLMWVAVTFIYTLPAVAVIVRLLSTGSQNVQALAPNREHFSFD
jgi:putative membrane protein